MDEGIMLCTCMVMYNVHWGRLLHHLSFELFTTSNAAVSQFTHSVLHNYDRAQVSLHPLS